jgi:hypothetical protein
MVATVGGFLGAVTVVGVVGFWVVAGLGFSTKATRVRAAGVGFGSLAMSSAAGDAMVRVCIGPVRSVCDGLSCQFSVPVRLSSTSRCSNNTNAPQRSKLRVSGRPDRDAVCNAGEAVLMGSQSVGQVGGTKVWAGGKSRMVTWAGSHTGPFRPVANPSLRTTARQMRAALGPPGLASRRRRWPKTPATPRPRPGVRPHRTRAHTGPKCQATAH